MAAMKAWGIRPQEWRMMAVDDKADVMVHEYLDGIRSLYRFHQLKEKKGPKKPEGGGGMAAFKALGERFRKRAPGRL
jgi:hypothetical protein